MCCLASVLLLVGPRAGILVWWLMDQTFRLYRASRAFLSLQ